MPDHASAPEKSGQFWVRTPCEGQSCVFRELGGVGQEVWTHKAIICWKRYAEGKEASQIARETRHSLAAVDAYLGQYDRVRRCRQRGMSPRQTAHILNCSVALVDQYLDIDRRLEDSEDES